jgi:hypothetical protein
MNMKKTLYAVAVAATFGVTPALAGSLSDPVVTPIDIIEDTTASSSSAMALVAMLAVLMAIPALD